VTCTNNTPYTISLTPSNNSTTGAGEMSGTSGNLDKVPYNLRKVISGTSSSWGNISNNWVTGTGNAVNKDETVYVDVPSADFKPDTYSDTVTIRVNY
jgi:spore coat protein U-like protein